MRESTSEQFANSLLNTCVDTRALARTRSVYLLFTFVFRQMEPTDSSACRSKTTCVCVALLSFCFIRFFLCTFPALQRTHCLLSPPSRRPPKGNISDGSFNCLVTILSVLGIMLSMLSFVAAVGMSVVVGGGEQIIATENS